MLFFKNYIFLNVYFLSFSLGTQMVISDLSDEAGRTEALEESVCVILLGLW